MDHFDFAQKNNQSRKLNYLFSCICLGMPGYAWIGPKSHD